MAIALGIDLGTTNTVAAVATPDGVEFILGPRGERIHPSVVALPKAGGTAVGADAKMFRLTEPAHVLSSAKRFIGQNFRAPMVQLAMMGVPYEVAEGANQQPIAIVRDRRLTMHEISGYVLLHVKRCAERQLGKTVEKAVITVPANFTDAQRRATKEAGRIAGLEVLRLINEPTAAALAYGFGRHISDTVAVFDFGGGTLDVSVLRIEGEVVEVLASTGEFFLGGDDLDRALTDHFASELSRTQNVDARQFPNVQAKLAMAAEAVKCHLSNAEAAEGKIDDLDFGNGRFGSLPFLVTRKQFNGLINGYVEHAMNVAKEALVASRLEPRQISKVLCVGGSSRIPLIGTRLAELFGQQPDISINPDEVVAHGAAIAAGTLTGALADTPEMAPKRGGANVESIVLGGGSAVSGNRAPLPRPVLLDVNPQSLAVQTAGGFVDVVLEKNTPIPIERTRVFSTVRDNQTLVEIDCCRGEARKYSDNEPLGRVTLDGINAKPRGEVRIEITFRVDTDGILNVMARDVDSGVAQNVTLNVIGAPNQDQPALHPGR